jgi:hypothetical protein
MSDEKDIDPNLVQAREELVAEGLLRDSGRRRSGQIVWEMTEKGKQLAAEQLAADKAVKH